MNKATLRLFNAVHVEKKMLREIPKDVHSRTIRNGYILSPYIDPSDNDLDVIESVIGLSAEKANAAFHKSWSIIRDTPLEELVIQQLIHYLTTYGFEELGIYREDAVYIPAEQLDITEVTKGVSLTVIKGMDSAEILENIVSLGSGIALAKETLADIMEIVESSDYNSSIAHRISNRELKGLIYDFYNFVPEQPVEYLRYVISKLTNESLLIKNEYLIQKIEESNGKFLDVLLKDAPENMAEIFFRYKPIFLALKRISKNKTYFNKLRKQASKLHVPLSEDYLNNVTSRIKNETLDFEMLISKLETASVFRKIRLAYALKHRINPCQSIVYRIRNGRGWVNEFKWPLDKKESLIEALDIVIKFIALDIRKNVEGKSIYIPKNVHYTLPATEKQYTGNIPTGSYISVENNLIVGIHWINTNRRIDLDLSMIGVSGKIGWDASYFSLGKKVLFSGDVTNAPPPNGATELFYISKRQSEPRILSVNYFNYSNDDPVTTKLIVASEKPKNFRKNYMVDVNNMLASVGLKIDSKQSVIGLVTNVDGENRIYFAKIAIGTSISARNNIQSKQAREFLFNKMVNSIKLVDILKMAGANIFDDKGLENVIDLSPEELDKNTILDLIQEK